MRKILLIAMATIIGVGAIFGNGIKVQAAREEETTPSGIPISELEDKVDEYVDQYIGKGANGAAIVYIHHGEIIFSKGYGYGDVSNKIPVDPDKTVFEYASISKTFTWTAIMQLVEEGKIDLDEDIKTYLPAGFYEKFQKKLSFDQSISVMDLMNHRAGFEDFYFYGDYTKEKYLSDDLGTSLIKAMPKQIYEPNTVTAYSNFSTDLAGYIVECVTKEKLYNYLQENIFTPVGMDSTSANPRYDELDYIVDNKAMGYGEDVEGKGWTYLNLYPDGSVNGTATDLAKFAIALMNDKGPIFDNANTGEELFSTSYSRNTQLTGCAHGFWEGKGENIYYHHDGGHDGFTTIYGFSPDTQSGVIVLTNTGDEPYIPYGVMQLVMGDNQEIDLVPCEDGIDAMTLDHMEFLTARKNQGDLTKVYSYISGNDKITAVNHNTIIYHGLTYIQTAPNYFQLADHGDNLIARGVYGELYFGDIDGDGKIDVLNGGGIASSDSLKAKVIDTNIGLIIQLILGGLSFLVIIMSGFRMFLEKLKKKNMLIKNEFNMDKNSIRKLTICGIGLLINMLILIAFILSPDGFSNVLRINIQVGINLVIGIVSIILLGTRIFMFIKNEEIRTFKIKHSVVIALMIILILMWKWNFFMFIL